nr:CxxxxCH/CxxCH domain-containing protein [Melioribacteraceae bacterium]
MKYTTALLILLISLFFAFGCSEINDEITPTTNFTHHPEGFGDANSDNFHKSVFVNNNWSFNLTECQSCHAADYNGGTVGVSCLNCHTQPAGPEACNTCHGNFADPDFIAPPNDLEGNSDSGFKGVGAHYKHVYDNGISINIGCFECHQQTSSEGDYVHAHISPPPAKIQLSELAFSDSLGLNPEYDFANLDCSNTYCHGGFKYGDIEGNNRTVTWNSTSGKEAVCGTCHGEVDDNGDSVTPLPKGHFGTFVQTQCFM